MMDALSRAKETWCADDGIPMVDYSQSATGRVNHNDVLDSEHFSRFIEESKPLDIDIMLEIKDKELSALKAISIACGDNGFFRI